LTGVLRLTALAVVLVALTASAGSAAGAAPSFVQIASGLHEAVYVTSAPSDPSTLYVVEQRGTIEMVRDGKIAGTFLDLSSRVLDDGERGLLSLAFDPGYAQNHQFYVDYSDLNGDSHVAELTSANGVGVPTSAHDLLVVKQPYPNHKGGQLQFDKQGRLYVGLGDGGTNPAAGDISTGDPQNHAQNLGSPLGKLLRLTPNRPGARWQTVGMGLRNPWRFSFDRQTGNLWIGDVGAAQYEEVDFRPQAKVGVLANYGWSRFEGPVIYNPKIKLAKKGTLVNPIWTYSHSGPVCAIVGGYVYRGASVPAMRGRYLFGDYCAGTIWSFKTGAKGRASAPAQLGTVPDLSSFGQDANGELYAVSLDGGLYALR
jgi:glucose/arabinose dehydrogenase